jgi:hypothetical protein
VPRNSRVDAERIAAAVMITPSDEFDVIAEKGHLHVEHALGLEPVSIDVRR